MAAGVPRELERLILRCLRKEPERRYQTMLDVKNELQEIKEESALRHPCASAGARRVGIAVARPPPRRGGASSSSPRPPGRSGPRAPDLPPMRVVPLTSLNGVELCPTFSPDGEQVAFSWEGEKQDSSSARDAFDIYLKLVGSSDVRRLTTDPGVNWAGGWSPDGRQIACFRDVRLSGGDLPPRRRSTEPSASSSTFPRRSALTWSPDGRGSSCAACADGRRTGGIYFDPGGRRSASPRRAATKDRAIHHVLRVGARRPSSGLPGVSTTRGRRPAVSTSWSSTSDGSRSGRHVAWRMAASTHSRRRLEPGQHIRVLHDRPAPETFYLSRAWVTGDRAPERLDWRGSGRVCRRWRPPRNRMAFSRTHQYGGRVHAGIRRRVRCWSPPSGTSSRSSRPTAPACVHVVTFGRGAPPLARFGGRLQCAPVDARARRWEGSRPGRRMAARLLLIRGATTATLRSGRSTPTAAPHAGSRRAQATRAGRRGPGTGAGFIFRPTRVMVATPGGCPRPADRRARHARRQRLLLRCVDGRQGSDLQARSRRLPPARPAARAEARRVSYYRASRP